jgi:hypothetical protein
MGHDALSTDHLGRGLKEVYPWMVRRLMVTITPGYMDKLSQASKVRTRVMV